MAGKRGRSGRKRGSGMTAVEHAARGTYKPSVHGPLPPGVIPVRNRPVLARSGGKAPAKPAAASAKAPSAPAAVTPETLTAADCPEGLTAEGRALWGALVTQRPTDKLFAGFVAIYVEAVLQWQRATLQVQSGGDYGKLAGKPGANPYLKIRREAQATMFQAASFLGWQAPVQNGALTPIAEPPKSRLELFLQARGGA
jgi:hypothetical protein